MNNSLFKQISLGFAATIAGALLAFGTGPAFAEDTAATPSIETHPTLSERFEKWSTEPISFTGIVTNSRRSTPDFQMKIDDIRYSVLFDAGRAKRNAILDCLDLSDSCEVKGTAFMYFEKGKMRLNVTDVTWLAIPAIDFDVVSSHIHRCVRSEQYKRKSFASVVETRLEVLDITRPPRYTLDPVKPREGGRGFDIVDRAIEDCMRRRLRLPVGVYHLKVFTQSSDAFLDYWQD